MSNATLTLLSARISKLSHDVSRLMFSESNDPGQLPLLDKVKLFTLYIYSINAILHSFMELENDAAAIDRINTYIKQTKDCYEKITRIESKGGQSPHILSVNVPAIARIIRHDL
jgi:flagellin-specific chaperone FliS